MKRLLVLLAVVAASSLAVNAAAAPVKTIRKCIPDREAGIDRVGSVTLITYCGHAKLTLKQGTKATTYTNAMCLKTPGNLTVGFGKYTAIVQPLALSNALVLVAPAAGDGTYRLSLLTVQKKGKKATLANNVKVVIAGKRSRGTFSGRFDKGAKFTGSFTCK
jgi:hypothetical protein